MRALYGQGTPKEAARANDAFLFVLQAEDAFLLAILAVRHREISAFILIALRPASD
jgi:hypothetical protein